jgi:hypothetical protein
LFLKAFVAKGSGRNEPMWIAIHKCMGETLGISLYSYLYPKLPKTVCLSYYLLYFLFNKIGEEEGGTGSTWKWVLGGGVGREVSQTTNTHVISVKMIK